VEAIDQPTTFGPVSVVLTSEATGLSVKLSNKFRQAPERVLICVPWFYEVKQVEADGRPLKVQNGRLALAPTARAVKIKGSIKPGTPDLSYENAVRDYKKEYRARYQEFLRTGQIRQ